MKKNTLIFAIVSLLFSLSGCNTDDRVKMSDNYPVDGDINYGIMMISLFSQRENSSRLNLLNINELIDFSGKGILRFPPEDGGYYYSYVGFHVGFCMRLYSNTRATKSINKICFRSHSRVVGTHRTPRWSSWKWSSTRPVTTASRA